MFNLTLKRSYNKPSTTQQCDVAISLFAPQTTAHWFGSSGCSVAVFTFTFAFTLLIGCMLLSAAGCQKTETPPVAASNASTAPSNNDTGAIAEKIEGAQTPGNSGMAVAPKETIDSQSINAKGNTATLVETEKQHSDSDGPIKPALAADESKVFLEKQITAVEYRNQSGNSIKVTFQTSALAALEADVLLSSGKRILLTAPKDEGNNPTYRSSDGSVELVTHGGGGSIDLVFNGKSSSFDAVSAEAEVVAPRK